jgi:hypothetical protein
MLFHQTPRRVALIFALPCSFWSDIAIRLTFFFCVRQSVRFDAAVSIHNRRHRKGEGSCYQLEMTK